MQHNIMLGGGKKRERERKNKKKKRRERSGEHCSYTFRTKLMVRFILAPLYRDAKCDHLAHEASSLLHIPLAPISAYSLTRTERKKFLLCLFSLLNKNRMFNNWLMQCIHFFLSVSRVHVCSFFWNARNVHIWS